MSDNETAVILVLSLFVGLPVLGVLTYFIATPFNRWNEFRKQANEVHLSRIRAEVKLDLKLREWQQTKSLEDLERHRRRLEHELDELHANQDRNEERK